MQRAVLTVLIVVGVACSGAQGAGQAQAPSGAAGGQEVVARMGDRTITLKDVDAKWQELDPSEQARLQQMLYQNRRNVLEQMIGEMLIEQAAKAAGVPTEQYLKAEIDKRVQPVTEADMQQFYEENKERAQGRTYEQLKDQIGAFLTQQQGQIAQAKLMGELRDKADSITVLLDPPRREVALEDHDPVRGPANAPVTIIEFSDFQCPFCGRVTPTIERLREAYPDKIKVVFKDFPLPSHPLAPKAGEAAHCAGDQGKYWEMHDRLFANQNQLEVPALKQHAAAIGLDQAKFDECLDSGKFGDIMNADMEEGQKLGVSSTPTLYINGRPVVGAQPYEYFQQVVEEELARQGQK
ncbi:MAG: thioredoxin domain-containing protein [Vicinamibacterales bacterium]